MKKKCKSKTEESGALRVERILLNHTLSLLFHALGGTSTDRESTKIRESWD